MELCYNDIILAVFKELEFFYEVNTQIKISHGLHHIIAVHKHVVKAIKCVLPQLSPITSMEIQVAALLHDVDDYKYFGKNINNKSEQGKEGEQGRQGGEQGKEGEQGKQGGDQGKQSEQGKQGGEQGKQNKQNAKIICSAVGITPNSMKNIIDMIEWVGCSENGNSIPPTIVESKEFFRLIPRWADRLEAVGAIGVVRCYQYGCETNRPLFSKNSPRATTKEEVFACATPERFSRYLLNGGRSEDMISHYYDKLLHIACPPPEIVCNSYLEEKVKKSSEELIEVCLHFGKTGEVDVEYMKNLEKNIMEKYSKLKFKNSDHN
jgi:uncharacterized protein